VQRFFANISVIQAKAIMEGHVSVWQEWYSWVVIDGRWLRGQKWVAGEFRESVSG
jgi:hypothetical protein